MESAFGAKTKMLPFFFHPQTFFVPQGPDFHSSVGRLGCDSANFQPIFFQAQFDEMSNLEAFFSSSPPHSVLKRMCVCVRATIGPGSVRNPQAWTWVLVEGSRGPRSLDPPFLGSFALTCSTLHALLDGEEGEGGMGVAAAATSARVPSAQLLLKIIVLS